MRFVSKQINDPLIEDHSDHGASKEPIEESNLGKAGFFVSSDAPCMIRVTWINLFVKETQNPFWILETNLGLSQRNTP